jgi:hypothetical protein
MKPETTGNQTHGELKQTSDLATPHDFDNKIFDLVLKALYSTSANNGLSFENEILPLENIRVSAAEAERLWNVMLNSGWFNPIAGFGNAGKLILSASGFQLMSKYGGYFPFLASSQAHKPAKASVHSLAPHKESLENPLREINTHPEFPEREKIKKNQ